MNTKQLRITLISLVAALWLGLSLWAWLSPAEEMSEAERRKLQQLPEISVETLLWCRSLCTRAMSYPPG